MTNFERIKNMSAEKLVGLVFLNCRCCVYMHEDCSENEKMCCEDGMLKWLKTEAEEPKFDESVLNISNPIDKRKTVNCKGCKLLNNLGYANSKLLDYLPHIVECLQKTCKRCAISGSCKTRQKAEFCETLYSSLAEFIEYVSRRQ